MNLIKKEQLSKKMLDMSCEYWDLSNGFIAEVDNDGENMLSIYLYNDNDIYNLAPAERCVKEEKLINELQDKIKNINKKYWIDAVYMSCPKDQLMDILTTIEQHINNQR